MVNHNYFGTGFTRPPGNDRQRTVLSWHYYCWLLQFAQNPLHDGKYSLFDRIVCDKIQLTTSFESIRLDTLALGGGPSFLSEFGVCAFPTRPEDPNSPLNTEECERILEEADRFFQSWAYWDSNFYDPKTLRVNSEIVRVFSRVYPVAINGDPTKVYFNGTSREFLFKFKMFVENLEQAERLTEVFIPRHVYGKDGFDVRLTSNLKWKYDFDLNRVLLSLDEPIVDRFRREDGLKFEQEMIVSITSRF